MSFILTAPLNPKLCIHPLSIAAVNREPENVINRLIIILTLLC
jgi:hypothetical protein